MSTCALSTRRAAVHARCSALTSLDVLHVDFLQTQNDERDDDERDDDERDEQDERAEVPDERVRVRVQELRDQETKSRSKNPQKPQELKAPRDVSRPQVHERDA